MKTKTASRQLRNARKGASAVELAVVGPILATLLIGTIEIGQYYNVWQKVSNASREGARAAARYSTSSDSDVQRVVAAYMSDVLPGVAESTITSALTTSVKDSSGQVITDLTSVSSGSQITVEVSLQFGAVAWIKGIPGIDEQNVTTATVMRRE